MNTRNIPPLIITLKSFKYVLLNIRFSLIMIIPVLGLLFMDQGQDLLREIVDDKAYFTFFGGSFIWVWSIWYWARISMAIRPIYSSVSEYNLFWYRRNLPRLIGSIAIILLALNLFRAAGFSVPVFVLFIMALLLYKFRQILTWTRLKLWPRYAVPSFITKDEGNKLYNGFVEVLYHRPYIFTLLLLADFSIFWGVYSPLSLGSAFNTLVLLFLWGATSVPIFSVLAFYAGRTGIPIFTILVFNAIVFSSFNDNHKIRAISDLQVSDLHRPSLEATLRQWTQKHHCTSKQCPPFIVMATAGGGIRAAYWTATVLGQLDDTLAIEKGLNIRDNLYAISGVSGGSLGATVYRAALEAGVEKGHMVTKLQEILSGDFLSPLVAGLLYPDLYQLFIPFPIFEDRAVVFERALEQRFAEIVNASTMEASFVSLTADRSDPWPALFLNSTWSNNGRRIVAAGITLYNQDHMYSDMLDLIGYDIRLSTAAHNSARFPYLSPPGSWVMSLDAEHQGVHSDKPLVQRLQDGGLFENYGAETLLEILQSVQAYFTSHDLYFDPMIIVISSDPNLPKDLFSTPIKEPISFGYEALTTLNTYEAARSSRGLEAVFRLRNYIQPDKRENRFIYFRMCSGNSQQRPPLGWTLSHAAQREISAYLISPDFVDSSECRTDNKMSLKRVKDSLH